MENQNRSIAFSWIVPSAILMIVVLTMLFSFSLKSSSEATETVSKNLIEATEQYSNQCWIELNSLKAVAQPIKCAGRVMEGRIIAGGGSVSKAGSYPVSNRFNSCA